MVARMGVSSAILRVAHWLLVQHYSKDLPVTPRIDDRVTSGGNTYVVLSVDTRNTAMETLMHICTIRGVDNV